MAASLMLYELPPSPNNARARLALKYKRLDYERKLVDPADRSELIQLSTQPLTPVLVHDRRVIFDSHAIVRYLDANFPETPRLFSADRDEMRAIERWEVFSRHELSEPVGTAFREAFASECDRKALTRATEMMHETTSCLEEHLQSKEWLVGDRLTAAELFVAPLVRLAMLPAAAARSGPVSAFFVKNLRLGDGREATKAWVNKVFSYDE